MTSPKVKAFHIGVAAEAFAAAQFARCGLDVSVQYGANQPEYDLMIEVERISGKDTFGVILVVGNSQVTAFIDGGYRELSGIFLINGKHVDQNGTQYKGTLLEVGKKHRIRFMVRKSRVVMEVNNRRIVDWRGDSRRLSLHSVYKLPLKDSMGIEAWDSTYRVTKFTLISMTGRGRKLR